MNFIWNSKSYIGTLIYFVKKKRKMFQISIHYYWDKSKLSINKYFILFSILGFLNQLSKSKDYNKNESMIISYVIPIKEEDK